MQQGKRQRMRVEGKNEGRPDVEAIMARIRNEVKQELGKMPSRKIAFQPRAAEAKETQNASILYSDELNYLNAHWQDWAVTNEITSHRRIIGPLIVWVKRRLVDIAWNYLLRGYFERERQFQMRLVRFLNASSRYTDSRDSKIFWELIEKIDSDVAALNERVDVLFDQLLATMRERETEIERRLDAIEKGGICEGGS